MKMSVLETIHPESGFLNAPNWSKIGKMIITLQFFDMTSPLLLLVTGPTFMLISLVVLDS